MKTILSLIRISTPLLSIVVMSACSLLPGNSVPDKISDACITTQVGSQLFPTNQNFKNLINLLTKTGGDASWESVSEETGFLHVQLNDKFTGKKKRLDMEVKILPKNDKNNCNGKAVLINRVQVDGDLLSPYNTSNIVLSLIQTLDRESNVSLSAPMENSMQSKGAKSPNYEGIINDRDAAHMDTSDFSSSEQRLIEIWANADEMCRGSSDGNTIDEWCPKRDEAMNALNRAGLCYGSDHDASAADYKIHRCDK